MPSARLAASRSTLRSPPLEGTPPLPRAAIAGDGSHWRAQLPDGRTAVIRRVPGGDGEGSLKFAPAVYGSALGFVTGPECGGVLAAAQWAAGQVSR